MTFSPIAEQADLAFRLAREDPQRAEALANRARALAVEAGLSASEATALRALGLAARERHDIPAALGYLDAAVTAAERSSDPHLLAETRLSLAAALAFAGDNERSMATLDATRATGTTAVMVAAQRAGLLSLLGRYEEALVEYRMVIPAFRRLGDPVREGRARNNRGLLHIYAGRFARAEADLTRAEALATAAGHLTEAAGCCHNRGLAAARKGDLPVALSLFDEADRRCREMGVQSGARGLDRAAVLLAAGLIREARAAADEGLAQLREGGNHSNLAQGLVLLADIALLDGDPVASQAAAEEATGLFDVQLRRGWSAVARASAARAALTGGPDGRHDGGHDGEPERRSVHAALAVAASGAAIELEDVGLIDRATMAHAVAGQLWLASGDTEAGLAELARAGRGRRRGTAAGRLAAWEAEAVRRLWCRDRRGAMAALRCALALVEDQQTSLGATELRAHIAVHADAAAGLGLRLALETDRAGCLWQWMERHRANSLRVSPARPPPDRLLASCLAELRGLAHEIASCSTTGSDPRALLTRQAELERRVRERAWQARGAPRSPGRRRTAVATLVAALGDAALVEMADIDGLLHAVVAVDGRTRHVPLGVASEAHQELAHLRLAMRRLAYGGAHAVLGAGARLQLTRAATNLDRLLLAPIARLIGARDVVMVPTGELHATPWAVLPTLAGRAVSVAPSARLWLEATVAERTGPNGGERAATDSSAGPASVARRVVVVAGPGLTGARHEALTIGAAYPGAKVLTGSEAQVVAVSAALEGSGLAHVAAHGVFRADNGLWSSLELADGSLTVYDLEQLRRPPRLVVLSACQSGLSAVRPGDELMGLVAALLTLGTRAVVAAVVPVEDQPSEAFMIQLHEHLRSGHRPAVALARAQQVSGDPVGGSYVCFGSG